MSKQLQDKIQRLQSEKSQQQSQFMQKKQHYESIIQSLQSENEKLRKYIEENSQSFSLIESQAKSIKSQKQKNQSPVRGYEQSKNVPDDEKQKAAKFEEVSIENRLLKQQLSDLARIYEDQIEEMTNYFNKIQEAYTVISHKTTNAPKEGQITDLVNAYENLLKDFESERLKYIEKIEELTGYIIQFEQKYKQVEQGNNKLEIQLKIVRQELKIYKRSKIIK